MLHQHRLKNLFVLIRQNNKKYYNFFFKILFLESVDMKLKLVKIKLDLDLISDMIGLLTKILLKLLKIIFVPNNIPMVIYELICILRYINIFSI